MTQEEKSLLLKDLCARLPHRVVVKDRNGIHTLSVGNTEFTDLFSGKCNIKHYLRPMSSMTEEEKKEFENLLEGIVDGIERWDKPDLCEEYDWLNAHHFDYRGLIEKGLAIEAPKGMYEY
jgi:hypothetical protein